MAAFFARPPDPSTRLRLFCFPYAGGGSARFHTWSRELNANIQVCPVQLPGRESRRRDPPFTAVQPLVESLAGELDAYLDRPFAVFGHSTGAIIGFELVRHLRRQGRAQPVCLFVSAARAPQGADRRPPMHCLPDDRLVSELSTRYNGIPRIILEDPQVLALFLPVIRADLMLLETYRYGKGEPLTCRLVAFGGDRDYTMAPEDLSGWSAQSLGDFALRLFPGDHFFLHSAQGLLLEALAEYLEPFC